MQNHQKKKTRIIVAITGASGAIYAIKILKQLQQIDDIESHLTISKIGHITIKEETDLTIDEVESLADRVHKHNDLAACISSGSYQTEAMIVAPCSMKTLAEIASGFTTNLISRSADVILKERKKLILLTRETPLNAIHLENMLKLARLGVDIVPPVPAFYNKPKNIDDIVNHTVGRVFDLLNIETLLARRWKDD
jgi:4-hydroxy-3-polyprenylbenzoate decarboxylase